MRPLEDLTLNDLGLQAEFECEISKAGMVGEWFKGDEPIKSGDKYDIIVEGTVHRLVIKEAYADDEAKYTVKFRDVSTTGKLTILGNYSLHCHTN